MAAPRWWAIDSGASAHIFDDLVHPPSGPKLAVDGVSLRTVGGERGVSHGAPVRIGPIDDRDALVVGGSPSMVSMGRLVEDEDGAHFGHDQERAEGDPAWRQRPKNKRGGTDARADSHDARRIIAVEEASGARRDEARCQKRD